MEQLLTAYKQAYLLALNVHFRTLTTCYTRHKGTEEVYENLFEGFHDLSEKYQQIVPSDRDPNSLVEELYETVENLKNAIKEAITKEKDEGVKNQLIQKYDDLQLTCAKIHSLIDEDEQEEYEASEKVKVLKLS